MLFSQRKGLKPVKSVIQVDSMDDDLRNGLWNAVTINYWNRIDDVWNSGNTTIENIIESFLVSLWINYFKNPIDALNFLWPDIREKVRKYFFTHHWNEIYDLIEFMANSYPFEKVNKEFMNTCNDILKRELSAYRFVGSKITEVTSEEEIAEIEEALEATTSLKSVKTHLKAAFDLFSNRKSPDYRNSIKESISAVEGICRLIAGDGKAVLGDALKTIKKEGKIELHAALESAFQKLYGYTSDSGGIRHALEEPKPDFEEAKFMLVSCSAFINYLITKSSKAGTKLQ